MSQPLPDPTKWLAELFKSSQAVLWPSEDATGTAAPTDPWTQGMKAFTKWQADSMRQLAAPWAALNPATKSVSDKRFAGEAWNEDPRYDLVARTYLAQTDLMRKALAAAPLDERTKAQWGFALRQVTDALSPANTLATNPEAMQLAVETGGASLAEGFRLFTEDLVKGRISMTDDTAFEVGRNVCLSKGSVVFQNELIQLIQYTPTTGEVHDGLW